MIEKVDEKGHPLIKIGGHFQRSEIDNLDLIWQKELTADEIEWSTDNTLRYFELIDVPLRPSELNLTQGYSCVYSLTETEVPYVTHIPMNDLTPDPNVVVLGGMSGVGAKGAMTYGLIGANLLLGKSEDNLMYQTVEQALGFERLLKDIENSKEAKMEAATLRK